MNEAILPVYILHQTIIVVIGYYIVQWSLGIPAKAALITFAALMLMGVSYLIVKKISVLRYLFGMKL